MPVCHEGHFFEGEKCPECGGSAVPLLSLPSELLEYIAQFVAGTKTSLQQPIATNIKSIKDFALLNRQLYHIANALPIGFRQLKAIGEHAATPNHSTSKFESKSHVTLPERFLVNPECINLFRVGGTHTAYCGVANIREGSIYIYPLKESGPKSDDGYENKPWKATGQMLKGKEVVPINHFGDPRSPKNWVSHETFAYAIMGGKIEDYIGFTLWSKRDDTGRMMIVWSSRSLNKDKFYSNNSTKQGGGTTTKVWAEHISAALEHDLGIATRPDPMIRFSPVPAIGEPPSKKKRKTGD